MLPPVFARVSPRSGTPVNNPVIVAIIVAVLAAFVPLDYLIDVVSIGTHPERHDGPDPLAGERHARR